MGRFVGAMTWRPFLLGYVAFLLCGAVGGLASRLYFGISYDRFIFAFCGLLLLVAAAGQSRATYVYRLIRNVGWFSAIENDRKVRLLLLVLAVALFVGAAFAK
jgi:hypothetical protein